MAFWNGDMTPAVREWRWKEQRVYNPFRVCTRSGRSLFLRKAHYGRFYIDWEYSPEYGPDKWLSKEEYLLAMLRDELQ